MKNIKIIVSVFTLSLFCFSGTIAQENVYVDAMKEEIQRNMDGLILDRMLAPEFISYNIVDAKALHVKAVLGAIVKSDERPFVNFDNRILVMEDGITNENYIDRDNLFGRRTADNRLPITGDKDDVRRALWLATDQNYKAALNEYEKKISARNRQSLSPEELELTDFLPAEKHEITVPFTSMDIDKAFIEDLARSLSSVFARYGSINSSGVDIYVYDAQVFYHSSEGTLAVYPFQVAAIMVTASTQNETGEVLQDHFIHFAKDFSDIPNEDELLGEVKKVAENLDKLTKVTTFSEHYTGPVLFEGQAAVEAFAQVFFGDIEGLVAVRKPIVGDEQIMMFAPDMVKENNLESRIGRRIVSRDISVEAMPKLSSFEGVPLFGSFKVDAEGLSAMDKVSLIEEGSLSSLLSSRTPTLSVGASNAHARLALSRGSLTPVVAPGVVKMSFDDSSYDIEALREMLISEAEDEGLDYAYIVRKVVSSAADFSADLGGMIILGQSREKKDLSKTIQVYRVYVEDGREEPVSLAEVEGLNIGSFRRLLGASEQMQVYNTMFKPANERLITWGFGLTGVPVSYIVPEALLFEELEIKRESQRVVKRPPVVSNPVK